MLATAADVPLQIRSENSRSERRVTPSWTISHFKARLEPITGVPASCQRLTLHLASQPPRPIEAADEDSTQLVLWPLQANAEIEVTDTRPAHMRTNYTDVSNTPKYEMPAETYSTLPNSVLAYKKSHKLGRFDPSAPSIEEAKIAASFREVSERRIVLDARCRLLPETDHRRGTVRFVGEIQEIPGVGAWVGVELDEPTGKNDGSVKVKGEDGEEKEARFFSCKPNFGVFVRPERVEIGEFEVLDEFAEDDDEEF